MKIFAQVFESREESKALRGSWRSPRTKGGRTPPHAFRTRLNSIIGKALRDPGRLPRGPDACDSPHRHSREQWYNETGERRPGRSPLFFGCSAILLRIDHIGHLAQRALGAIIELRFA